MCDQSIDESLNSSSHHDESNQSKDGEEAAKKDDQIVSKINSDIEAVMKSLA